MKEEDRKKIEQIKHGIKCAKEFECMQSDVAPLCKAQDIGINGFVECLELNPMHCPFTLPFGNGCFCKCPLRVYLAKELKK